MQNITLRVLSGADRGQAFRDLETPITIGREEGNTVQLNDERISRYHVKIQEDDGRLVITDLDSTNGTRVNGHACSLKILRYGDTISVGRTVLVVGTREQVVDVFGEPAGSEFAEGSEDSGDLLGDPDNLDQSTNLAQAGNANSSISSRELTLPRGLSAGQSAELRELLDQVHNGLQAVVDGATVNDKDSVVSFDRSAWRALLMTQSEVSEAIRAIEDPQTLDSSNSDTGADS